ncbi:MAG TPA: hypothetical protein VLQ67_08115 [Arachnia sp.]|nr:hypothetical protein [Arachnia sp.]
MAEWHPEYDDLVALALQAAEPAERTRLTAHVIACGTCRAEYSAIEDDVQHALAASPSIAPPAGFSGRVLAAMGIDDRPEAAATRTDRPDARTWRRRLVVTVAASIAVGLALGVAGTLALLQDPIPTVGSVPGGATAASALVTGAGATVGSVGVTDLAGSSYLVITVTSARPGMTYDCIIVGSDGARRSAGTWTLESYQHGGQAGGSWVVALPEGGLDRVELIAESGAVWSTATF